MDYCKELYRLLNNQEYYGQPPTRTQEHTCQLNRLIKTFDPDFQSILCTLIWRNSRMGDFYCLHKARHPIVSSKGTPCEKPSGYAKGILKAIVQGAPSICRNTMGFFRKLSTYRQVDPGTFPVTIDASALYTSSPHDNGIAATASVLNTNSCQFPDAILQLIRFILDHNTSPEKGAVFQKLVISLNLLNYELVS
eukprot:g40519.t1